MLTANYKSLTSNSNRSHQIQIAHSTANSNRSQQIQIAHSELQITHSKLQITHSKFKSPTANSNRSQQIKVAHSKLQIINSPRCPRLSTASGATRLKIFVIHESATL